MVNAMHENGDAAMARMNGRHARPESKKWCFVTIEKAQQCCFQ